MSACSPPPPLLGCTREAFGELLLKDPREDFPEAKDLWSVMMPVVGHSGSPGKNPIDNPLFPGTLNVEWSWVCRESQEGSPGSGWCWRLYAGSIGLHVTPSFSQTRLVTNIYFVPMSLVPFLSLPLSFSGKDSKSQKKAGDPLANIFCPCEILLLSSV